MPVLEKLTDGHNLGIQFLVIGAFEAQAHLNIEIPFTEKPSKKNEHE